LNKILQGDALQVLKTFDDELVDCIVTSPPYYGLRDYGVDGQIGLEKTPQEYIKKLIDVFSECKRVLKKSGTFWLNISDTYGGGGKHNSEKNWGMQNREAQINLQPPHVNLQPKCMLCIPERLILSLIDDGWILRNKNIWHKPNHMPSSVKDRFTSAYEVVYLLVKNKKYYFDLDAVREPHKNPSQMKSCYSETSTRQNTRFRRRETSEQISPINQPNRSSVDKQGRQDGYKSKLNGELKGKNPGDVWEINTKPFPEAHFAVFPEALVERCVKSGSPKDGLVLDPFCGSGTTCLVAKKLLRNYVGIDLNPEYVEMSRKRVATIPERLKL